jgi:hypothetical protein
MKKELFTIPERLCMLGQLLRMMARRRESLCGDTLNTFA